MREEFTERQCQGCQQALMVNNRIYADTEPFACGDSLYHDSPIRDGYWWACAVGGRDPDAACGARLWPWRRWYLQQLCENVGLSFGAVSRHS